MTLAGQYGKPLCLAYTSSWKGLWTRHTCSNKSRTISINSSPARLAEPGLLPLLVGVPVAVAAGGDLAQVGRAVAEHLAGEVGELTVGWRKIKDVYNQAKTIEVFVCTLRLKKAFLVLTPVEDDDVVHEVV